MPNFFCSSASCVRFANSSSLSLMPLRLAGNVGESAKWSLEDSEASKPSLDPFKLELLLRELA